MEQGSKNMLPTLPPLTANMPDANSVLSAALNKTNGQGQGLNPAATVAGTAQQPETPFSALLTDAVGTVGKLESEAKSAVDGLMSGSGVDVHQAMIASEKASMSFELALAVRNKAVQSYQSVMGMQF